MIKFRVGWVYRNRINQLYEIVDIEPIYIFAKNINGNILKFKKSGKYSFDDELNDLDLIELITNVNGFNKKLALEEKIKQLQQELEELNTPSLDEIVLQFHKITDEEKIQFFNLLQSRIYQTTLDYYNDIISKDIL